jgi:REP element-mobilizing transposase RayT
MAAWNDTDTPLAYLITVRTYGTWLHGDERGSVDRFMNKYGSPKIPHRDARHAYNASIMKGDPVLLDSAMRTAVDDAIREVCDYKRWPLHAVNVRTNHFHTVIRALGLKPSRPLNAFKSYATRKMRERGLWLPNRSPWVDKGSERWLWTEESILKACDYVINGQGCDLHDFDSWQVGTTSR